MSKYDTMKVEGPYPFVIYDNGAGGKPGRILRSGAVSSVYDLAVQAGSGEGWIFDKVKDDTLQMVDINTKQIVNKPPLPGEPLPEFLRLEVGEEYVLKVPRGTKLQRMGQTKWQVVDQENPVLVYSEPDRFRLYVRPPWPYLEAFIGVVVT